MGCGTNENGYLWLGEGVGLGSTFTGVASLLLVPLILLLQKPGHIGPTAVPENKNETTHSTPPPPLPLSNSDVWCCKFGLPNSSLHICVWLLDSAQHPHTSTSPTKGIIIKTKRSGI